jgi:hypothetical protein
MNDKEKYLFQLDAESDKFDRLPRVCLAHTPGTNEKVRIVRGVEGKYWVHPNSDVERFNSERGITKHQVEAMLIGSMFGWESPGADPETHSCGSNESPCDQRRKSDDNTCAHYPK